MRSVSPPSQSPIDTLDALIKRRRRPAQDLLLEARAAVVEKYSAYSDSASEGLATYPASTFSSPTAEALHSNYELLRSLPPPRLYDTLRLATPVCSMCNERDPTQLDHFLPRELFPELSVLPENLIPCCSVCNHRKSTIYVDAAGDLVFAHAYKDQFGDRAFLSASVQIIGGGVAVVDYSIHDDELDQALFERLCRHFEALDLGMFYAFKAELEALERSIEVGQQLKVGVDEGTIADGLRLRARAAEAVVGRNHWRSVLLAALAEHADFCAGASVP